MQGGTTFFAFIFQLCYNVVMLSVLLGKKDGYTFWYCLRDGANVSGGGLKEGELVCDENCTQKELMLRTLVNKCRNDGVGRVFTKDVWGLDLKRFGFEKEGDIFVSDGETLCLPHDCKHG